MLRDMKAVLYYLAVDMRFSFMVFWSILIFSLTAMFVIVLSFDTNMIVSTSMAIYIFCGITGFLTTKETFPYCIKFGATRNQYLLSVLIYCTAVAAVFSTIHVIIQSVFGWLVNVAGSERFLIFHSVESTTLADTWYNQLLVDMVICFLLLSLGFLLGTIFYRLGLIGGFGALALIAILILLPTTRDFLLNALVDMDGWKMGLNFSMILAVALFAFLPNWGMLRKASTLSSATR
ncbi:MAG: DUF4052 family protein [Bacillota bacterium]|uniref:DUF4052 family protein n=1 Tax=Bacillus sp. RO2 TaxID=2723913 RepID=UPI00145C5745|nr:DUF4052 family protein [Bacillus sp. RO2]MEA3320194.1 DUF4052 family protein [Bacillota bacterium]NMH74971.1 DUF4052 family protein [Bacillus sp. RO2]